MKILFSNLITDFTSGFFISRTEIIKNYQFRGNYGEYYMFLISKIIISKYKIKELPIKFYDRFAGELKLEEHLQIYLLKACRILKHLLK